MLSNFMKKGNNLQEVPGLEPRAELGDAHPVEVETGEAPGERVPGLWAWEAWRGSALRLDSSAGFCSWCA